MVMRKSLFLATAMVLAAPHVQAGDPGDPLQSCDGSTPEVVNCLMARTAQWDKRMTVAYQQALKDATAQQHDQLRTAQRLWIQYRDANCLYYDLGEGTIARIDTAECMLNMTTARARELEQTGHK
jgi:uncharacterized protein YecT (DUF1311 family)